MVVWYYIGTANPAVKPGLAHEFRLFVWLKNSLFRCFGRGPASHEQVVITPSCGVALDSHQLNEENVDFSSRRRYHHVDNIQGQYVIDT